MTGRRAPPKAPVPPRKRQRVSAVEAPAPKPSAASEEAREMCSAIHQFGMCGGEWYDSKEQRLEQLLARLPTTAGSGRQAGATIVFVEPASAALVGAIVERCLRKATPQAAGPRMVATPMTSVQPEPPRRLLRRQSSSESRKSSTSGTAVQVSTEFGSCASQGHFPPVTVVVTAGRGLSSIDEEPTGRFRYAINYDLPPSGREYVRRLAAISTSGPQLPPEEQGVVYTLVEESELKSRRCREIAGLLKRAGKAAADPKKGRCLGGVAKAIEFDSQLEQLEIEDGDDDEEEEVDEADQACDCAICRGCAVGGTSYHEPPAALGCGPGPGVEVVRLPLRALSDLAAAAPLIAPRLPNHVCTLICLHCLNVHNPWEGWEYLFASSELGGSVRVVLVLADDASWHEYLDTATLCAGGVSWLDLLDVDSMDKTDALLERLVDHEAALLGGRSERIVLMGMSQGGGQSMLRFLRSKIRLGGWVGAVCHVPTAPHTPRDRDPLLAQGRPTLNCDRPIRLLAGEADAVFTPGLILQDAARLRTVGGYTNVQVNVQPGLTHTGYEEGKMPKGKEGALMRRARLKVPELLYVRQHLPAMLGLSAATPNSCL